MKLREEAAALKLREEAAALKLREETAWFERWQQIAKAGPEVMYFLGDKGVISEAMCQRMEAFPVTRKTMQATVLKLREEAAALKLREKAVTLKLREAAAQQQRKAAEAAIQEKLEGLFSALYDQAIVAAQKQREAVEAAALAELEGLFGYKSAAPKQQGKVTALPANPFDLWP
jgi:hypothetical protein